MIIQKDLFILIFLHNNHLSRRILYLMGSFNFPLFNPLYVVILQLAWHVLGFMILIFIGVMIILLLHEMVKLNLRASIDNFNYILL